MSDNRLIFLSVVQRTDSPAERLPVTFLPASHKDDAGHGGGCVQVENWAPKLNALAETLGDFRGLIDRDDGSRDETEVVRVLKRYSIENYLLDPLTVVAILVRDGITDLFPGCPLADGNVHKLAELDDIMLQSMVDVLCAVVEGGTSGLVSLSARVLATYALGKSLHIPKWVVDLRGHKSDADPHCLMAVYARSINPLCQKAGKPVIFPSGDQFFARCLDMQTRVLPGVLPADLVGILRDLQRPSSSASPEPAKAPSL